VRLVAVVPTVLPRQPVDLVVRALVDQRRRAGDAQPAQVACGIDDDERDARVGGKVTRLGPRPGRIERDAVVVDVDPDRRRMR
jgi:hypothetical protein